MILQEESEDRPALKNLRWGLVPFWAKDQTIGSRMINARSESVAEKPSFRKPFQHQRCLVLTDGFYEWQQQDGGKQPWRFVMISGEPFALAGLWDRWRRADAAELLTFTILTTTPNEVTRPVHDRMPVIMAPDNYERWLNPQTPREELPPLLRPYPPDQMTGYPVSRAVNNPSHDRPACIERIVP